MPDLLLGPIIGGLTHRSAYLWGRTGGSGVLSAWLGSQPDLSDAILAGASLPLRPEDGFAGVAPVDRLAPDTRYYYSLQLQEGVPRPGRGPHADGSYPSFVTFPEPGERRSFRFAFGSCFRRKDPASGQVFSILDRHRQNFDLRFMLFIGDQVYADEARYNALQRVAVSLDEYRQVYAHTWGLPALRHMLWNLPAFMILDDHEVDDDWRWLDHKRQAATIPWWDRLARLSHGRRAEERSLAPQRVQNALQAYWEHQGMHAPGFELPLELNREGQYSLAAADAGSLAYSFTFGAAAFFVMDTRSMRVRGLHGLRSGAQDSPAMLGEGQWRALEAWLMAVKDDFPLKFLVTSSALLFDLWLDIPRDRWSGFPSERRRLLALLANEQVQGVYVLAGDLHSSHAVQVELGAGGDRCLPLWEFCSSPLDQEVNRYSRLLQRSLRGAPVRRHDCPFVVSQNNFGQVTVDYQPSGKPRVSFEIFGEKGDLLARVVT
jgi:alkaline phosphatase D